MTHLTKDEARALLKRYDLRSTGPRIAVLRALSAARSPLSYSDVIEALGDTDWDPATVYRNLIKLKEAGIAAVVSRVEGISRYAIKKGDSDEHLHPHFVCDNCSKVSCLPAELTASLAIEGQWSDSITRATVQLRGECPECIEGGIL